MKNNRFAKITLWTLTAATLITALASCGVMEEGYYQYDYNSNYSYKSSADEAEEQYISEDGTVSYPVEVKLAENPEVNVAEQPVSTFSADVDTASYTLFRSLVDSGTDLDTLIENYGGWFRTEEFINYFTYSSYKEASEGELFGVNASLFTCPWNTEKSLLVLGLAADSTVPETAGNNFVFLIDVSGSMASQNKLPLLKKAFTYLTDNLAEDDLVSIVVYAGNEAVVLEGCPVADKNKILKAVNNLRASGSTNGEAGIKKAYEIAEKYYIEGGNNRIIIASDGDLNVGVSSTQELNNLVSEKRQSGVYLSVLGFGSGNYRDSIMETIADNGNGAYYFIDNETEAEKVFGTDLQSTIYTVAEDVKLQLTFNPETVLSYRQVGYENRQLTEQDFTDDTKDAGEVGAGHRVTVIYELELAENADSELLNNPEKTTIAELAIHWKNPGETESTLQETVLNGSTVNCLEATADAKLAAAVAETALQIRASEYITETRTLQNVYNAVKELNSEDGAVIEFEKILKNLISK